MPVIPAVKADLALSDAMAQFTFSIALFGMAFAPLVYGSLSDRYGRRPLLLSGLAIFLIGSLISAVADSVTVLVVGRLAQAIGAGCGVTLVRTIAADVYGPSRLVKVIAYVTMFYTLGPMISPMVGGFLSDVLGWRSVFAFALLLGSIVSAGAYLAIFEFPSAQRDCAIGGRYPARLRRAAHSSAVRRLCPANRILYGRLHCGSHCRGHPHEGAARSSRDRVRILFRDVSGGILCSAISFPVDSALASRMKRWCSPDRSCAWPRRSSNAPCS